MSYKKAASKNRNALFGSAAGGGDVGSSKYKKSTTSPATRSTTSASSPATITRRGYTGGSGSSGLTKTKYTSALSGEARAKAIKEAEDYRDKANKCMQSGLFRSADPVAASTFYKRAADAYQRAGDFDNERYYRISSGDCNMMINAYGSAATDYTRAAELTLEAQDTTDMEQKRRDASRLHKKAGQAYAQMNEKAKAAGCDVRAAMALMYGDESRLISKEALAGMEEAVEAHVPDVLNRYARYRQTGYSSYIDPDSDETVTNPTQQTLELAKSQIVTRAYAHEPVQDLIYLFVQNGEYASALYAAGAATAILQNEGISTLSLSRAFVTETIVTLAMGDPIAAEENYTAVHLQNTAYLSSRECKLAEELYRAIKMRDIDALEDARSPTGSNRAALANIHESIRVLVTELRITGVARKNVSETTTTAPKKKAEENQQVVDLQPPDEALKDLENMKTGYEKDAEEGEGMDAKALQDELDALDFGDDDDDDLDDDDFDLR